MSKRGPAGDHGSSHDPTAIYNNHPAPDMAIRADAGILANRKIATGKRRRTPGSPGPSNSADALGDIFGGSPSSTTNNNSFSQNMFGSGFQQPPASPAFGNTSQSFPQGNNNSTFGGSAFGAPSSQNPFGATQTDNNTTFGAAPASSGFQFGGNSTSMFSQPPQSVNNATTPAFGQPTSNNGQQSFGGFGQSNGGMLNNDSEMQISPEVTPSKNAENRPVMFGSNPNQAGVGSGNVFGQQATNNTSRQPYGNFAFGATPAKNFSNTTASSPSFNFTAGAASTPIGPIAASFKFGSATPQAPAASPFSFGTSNIASTPQATNTISSFNGFNAAAGSVQTTPVVNSFGASNPAAVTMPAVPTAPSPFNAFNPGANNISTALPAANPFGAFKPAASIASTEAAAASPFNTFKPAAAPSEAPVNLLNTYKPSATTNATAFANPFFKNANQGTPSTASNSQPSFGSAPNSFASPSLASPPATPSTLSSQAPPQEVPKLSFGKPATTSSSLEPSILSNTTPSNTATSAPKEAAGVVSAFTDAQSRIYKAHLELQSLNQSYREMLATMDASLDWTPLMHAYISQQAKIMGSPKPSTVVDGAKRKANDDMPHQSEKRMKPNDSPQDVPETAANDKSQTVNLLKNFLDNGSSEKPTNAEKLTNGAASQGAAPTNSPAVTKNMLGSQGVSNPFANLKAGGATSSPLGFKPTAPTANSPSASPFTVGAVTANNTSSNMFTAKPAGKADMNSALAPPAFTPTTASAPASAPPKFGSGGAPVNFLAQFGQSAQKTAELEKAKRKAEDFDSDEDDEAEWEEKYEAEQKQKKEKLAEESKKAAKFVPGVMMNSGSSIAPVNFLAQFGQSAQKTAAEEKAKRKAEEFDSDEDDEADWERQYAEKQRQKKAKLEEDSIAKITKFVPGKGFVFEQAGEAAPNANMQTSTNSSARVASSAVFGGTVPKSQVSAANNIFSGLADKPSSSAGSGSDYGTNDDDERSTSQQDSENEEAAMPKPKSNEASVTGKSLFDRITPADKSESPTKPKNPFNLGDSSSGDLNSAQPTSNVFGFGDKTSSAADHTWKVDTPIKFGNSANPTFNVEAATPTKTTMFTASESTTPAGKPFSTLFGNTKADTGKSVFGQTSSAPFTAPNSQSGSTGFNFTKPPQGSTTSTSPFLFPSTASRPSSTTTSRATSPGSDGAGMDSPSETGADGDAQKPMAQTELTGLNEMEKRDEDLLFEVQKALCKQYVPANLDESAKWENKGTGPLRILKHKETGVTRIIMRAAPSGRVVINSRVLKDTENTQRSAKIIQFLTLGTDGNLQTWTAQVGKVEDAAKLKAVLDNNKPT